MPQNNARTWARISLVITVLGLVMIAAGVLLDDSDFYWLLMVGLLLGITFFICFFIFRAQAQRLDRLFNREDLLAHWSFDPAQQLKKAEEEYQARKKNNRLLLLIITAFFVLIGGLFLAFGFDDLEEASVFLAIMLSVLLLIAGVALAAPRAAYRRMIRSLPEVFVGPYGAWVMGEYVQWRAPMTWIRQVTLQQKESGVVIAVEYMIRQRYGPQQHTCRIPVPAGCGQEAYAVAQSIASVNQVAFTVSAAAEENDADAPISP